MAGLARDEFRIDLHGIGRIVPAGALTETVLAVELLLVDLAHEGDGTEEVDGKHDVPRQGVQQKVAPHLDVVIVAKEDARDFKYGVAHRAARRPREDRCRRGARPSGLPKELPLLIPMG